MSNQKPKAIKNEGVKGFHNEGKKVYREEDKILVERNGEVVSTEEVKNSERDCTATMYVLAK